MGVCAVGVLPAIVEQVLGAELLLACRGGEDDQKWFVCAPRQTLQFPLHMYVMYIICDGEAWKL